MNLHDIKPADLSAILTKELRRQLNTPRALARFHPNTRSNYQFSFDNGTHWNNWNQTDLELYLPPRAKP